MERLRYRTLPLCYRSLPQQNHLNLVPFSSSFFLSPTTKTHSLAPRFSSHHHKPASLPSCTLSLFQVHKQLYTLFRRTWNVTPVKTSFTHSPTSCGIQRHFVRTPVPSHRLTLLHSIRVFNLSSHKCTCTLTVVFLEKPSHASLFVNTLICKHRDLRSQISSSKKVPNLRGFSLTSLNMRSSTLVSVLFAAGAFSSPVVQKRDYVTEVEIVTVVNYVTEGFVMPAEATSTAVASVSHRRHRE